MSYYTEIDWVVLEFSGSTTYVSCNTSSCQYLGGLNFYVASCQCYVDNFLYHVNTYMACPSSKGAAAALSSTRILHTDSPCCAASLCRLKVIVTISLGIRTQIMCQSQSLLKPLIHYYYITKSRSHTQRCHL